MKIFDESDIQLITQTLYDYNDNLIQYNTPLEFYMYSMHGGNFIGTKLGRISLLWMDITKD